MTIPDPIRWAFTGLAAALMTVSALPDVLRSPGAVTVFSHLGYPSYLLPFLGTAKMLGVMAVVAPVRPHLKEWAFAGLTFDLTGALYSHLSVGDPPGVWLPALMGLVLVAGSYLTHRTSSSFGDTPVTRSSALSGLEPTR